MTDSVTLPRSEPPHALTARPGAGRRRRAGRRPAGRARADLHKPALALILLASLLLRLWGIKQGLPYSYNVDEATHFVPRAVGFFGHDLNPNYFLNPPAYSYLLYVVFELWFGSADAVARTYATDPTSVFVLARVVAAVLGVASVWLTYLAGRRLFEDRNVGLVAAAVAGFAFLPIFYSHLALNDVPTLAPVALSLYGIAGVVRSGRTGDYVLAGIGVGLAAATKYTGGVTLGCLVFAAACGVRAADGSRARRAIAGRFALALLIALAAFVISNPYSVLDFSAFRDGLSMQASAAGGADPIKLGTNGSGISYYLWTFSWGLGWVPALAALGGAALLLARRRWTLSLVLLPSPVAFILYMGVQQRFFGRWLMPIFPIAAILGGYAVVELVRRIARGPRIRAVPAPVAGAIAAVVLLAQSVVTVIHDDAVLSRPDTRNLTRAWMVANVPPGSKVVVEPDVPANWITDIGQSLGWTPNGARWYAYPTQLTDVDQHGNMLPAGVRRYVVIDQYERTLRPELLDEYLNGGYCWLVVGSLQAGRAFADPRAVPSALAYYAALAQRARLVYHVSPFGAGDRSVPFSFDWSIDYYPGQYRLPGPEMSVYRLTGGRCGA
jgi:4-amino-4-deoxy-L-arabinose transferase-like glycosyltransferase